MNYVFQQNKDPYKDMNEISYSKKQYETGGTGKKAWAKENANPYYSNLYASGYGDIADFYKKSNADTAYGYQKGYQKGAGENIYAKQFVDTNKFIADQRKYASDVADNAYSGQKAITDNQIKDVNMQYDDTNRRHYMNYLKAKNILPQQLAAMGYTGGLSETSALGLASEYMNNVADTEMQKNSEISGLNAQLLKAYYDKEAQKAQNEAQFAQMGLDQYNTDRNWATNREMQKDTLGVQKEGLNLQKYEIDTSDSTTQRGQDINKQIAEMDDATQRYGIQTNATTTQRGQDINKQIAEMDDATQRYGIQTNAATTQRGQDINKGISDAELYNAIVLQQMRNNQSNGGSVGAPLANNPNDTPSVEELYSILGIELPKKKTETPSQYVLNRINGLKTYK